MPINDRQTKRKKGFAADIIPRIICLLLAVIIWLYVVFNSAPDYEKSFDGISVEPVNARVLDEYNLTVNEDILTTVEVVIYGKRGDISMYSAEDIRATVDFIGVDEAGEHSLPITLELPDGATVKNYSPRTLTVNVQSVSEKTVPVLAKPQYSTAYEKGTPVCKDAAGNVIENVTVTGPASEISIIDHVEACPVYEGMLVSSTTAENVPLIACTKDGTPIESDYIGIEPSTVTVEIPLYDEKVVDVVVENDNDILEDAIKSVTVSPEKIRIKQKIVNGRTLDSISRIVVATFNEENLTGVGRSEEFELPVTIDSKYENLSGFETVTVTVTYHANSSINTKNETFECTDIRVYNRSGINFECLTDSLTVSVRIPKEMDETILNNGFYLSGNIEDAEDGKIKMTFNVPDEYGEDVVALGEYYVEVEVAQ